MEVLFGGISSLLYGVADFLGGEGARRAPAAAVVLWAGALSFPLITAVALIVGGSVGVGDLAFGVLAGVAGAFGLVSLFAGLSRGEAAVVAPVSASLGAIVPVLVSIAGGDTQHLQVWLGVGLAIPAILLCSWVGAAAGLRAAGFFYGMAAGIGFGSFTVVIRLTDPASNLLPLIASRGASMAVVSAIGAAGVWQIVRFSRVPRLIVAANGLFDVTANVTVLLALRAGSLALAAVSASFYPAVTVLLARMVNGERLRRRQVAGLALTLASLALIALG